MEIREDTLEDKQVIALVLHHRETASAATAVCSAHALTVDELRAPDMRFWSAWEGETLLGIGAIRRLGPAWGEIKSMHTTSAARRRGVGRAILRHIVREAQACGITRLNLETGSWEYFEPARQFYRSEGFAECGPFAGYIPDRNSCFFERRL